MDNPYKKSDISKRILETRKQTEELKAQLQSLLDNGIGSSVKCTANPPEQEIENIKESQTQNKVQIIKSYDTAHSQHVTKASSSRTNLNENKNVKLDNQDKQCKKTRNYDVNETREYIRKQREKRLEQHKLQNEEKIKADLKKKKLQELHKKSMELVMKNVQAKRNRSKSRERTDFIRPVGDITKSRSSSQEKGAARSRPESKENYNDRCKSSIQENKKVDSINPNLLHPHYMLQTEENGSRNLNKTPQFTQNKIKILSSNSTDKNSGVKHNPKHKDNPLQPKNLFNTLYPPSQNYNLKSTLNIDNSNDFQEETVKNVFEKNLQCNLSDISGGASSENRNLVQVSNILEYKNIQNKNSSIVCTDNEVQPAEKISSSINFVKPKISDIAIATDSLKKDTKETQTNLEQKSEFPSWLQEKRFESNPLNFINSVKRKLQNAVNSPVPQIDVAVQSSFAQQNSRPETPCSSKTKEELMAILQHSAKSIKKSDFLSYMSHKGLSLDQKTIEHIGLIQKNFGSKNLALSENLETCSESDTSKNIPEISSESGTSLKKNAESVRQSSGLGLDEERLSFMKLKTGSNKDTNSGKKQTEVSGNSTPAKSKVSSVAKANSKSETKLSDNATFHTNVHYSSDFHSGIQSVVTQNSSIHNKTDKNVHSQIVTEPEFNIHSKRHSHDIPETTDTHSKNIPETTDTHSKNIRPTSNSEKYLRVSSNITVRNRHFGKNNSIGVSSQINGSKNHNPENDTVKSTCNTSDNKLGSSLVSTATDARTSGSKSDESQISSEKSDKYTSLLSFSRPSGTVSEKLSKSESNLLNINTHRGSDVTSDCDKSSGIPPLKEPAISLVSGKKNSDRNIERDKLMKNISVRANTSRNVDLNNTNEIHLKFETEIHLLNDFNESLRHFSEVEKAFNSLKNNVNATSQKNLQNQECQTSVVSRSSSDNRVTEDSISDENSELSTINFSRGFLFDANSSSMNANNTISRLDNASNDEDLFNISANQNLSNFENLHTKNFAGMTLRMFEQLIKDEDVRLENLKTILKIREQALLDRTEGELVWLEIQRKHLRETGKLHEASLIRKKQRGILVNHQKERHEMQRLKQMQKAASIERKVILKEQRNLIKHQLSTDKMLSKIKVNTPRERRLSGPLKVIQSHTESIRSETSFSRRSSSDKEKEVHNIMSQTHSFMSVMSEVSSDDVLRKDNTSRADSTDLALKLTSEACGIPISQMKRTLLVREAALQKRRKAAEELLQWHKKLLEEEKRITELESTANAIISQIPNSVSPDAADTPKYQFKGKQLNQLWLNLTGYEEKKFNENKTYPMSQIALERFCKSARGYSTRKKPLKQLSDSEGSEYSSVRVDQSLSENIPPSASATTGLFPGGVVNDYTSDFDIESLQDIVSAEDMDVVDKNINQLIDDFSRVQEDISSLNIKQALKSGISLEVEELSIRSDKTASDLEDSVIETAIISKEKPCEEVDLEENSIVSSSNKALSTLQDIPNNLSRSDEVNDDVSKSKSTDNKNQTDIPEVVSLSEASSMKKIRSPDQGKLQPDQNQDKISTCDKVSSLINENDFKDNLNKSQEILEELGILENHLATDTGLSIEDVQVTNEGKSNLSKTEEILLRLSQTEPKVSISESADKTSAGESDGVLLELQQVHEKSAVDVSCNEKEEKSGLSTEDIREHESSAVDASEDVSSTKALPTIEDDLVTGDVENEDKDILVLNNEHIDLKSQIISERIIEKVGSVEANEVPGKISEEPTLNSAIDEISEVSKKTTSVTEDNLIDDNLIDEDKNREDFLSDDIICNTESNFERVVIDNEHSKDESVAEVIDLYKNSIEEVPITQDSESGKEVDVGVALPGNEKAIESNCESLEEKNSEIEENVSSKHTTSSAIDYEQFEMQEKGNEYSISTKGDESVDEISQKEFEENSSSKTPHMTISEKMPLVELTINSAKESLEERVKDHVLEETSMKETEESEIASLQADHVTSLPSKETVNSYEEKELDSLSSSTTGSQTSIMSEKEDSHVSEKSKSSVSEETVAQSEKVDVKKRVSEILADTNQVSRGDKSPKLQDLYTTTYDLVSPTNSPEIGSPTEEHKILTAKTIFGTEAEELLRKQLAIEQEIKQITEQQQKEQLPYLYVREIPNKPPPPYTPPSSVSVSNVITIIPTIEEIEDITKYSAKILHKAYLSMNLDNISISENTLSLISKDITKECYKFVFDLCKEISKEHYRQFEKEECIAWLKVKKNSRLAVIKPLDVTGLEKHMNKKLKELFGYEKPMRRENAIIKWSRKKRDHVDEILVMESQAEESQWTNYEKDELLVMNEITNEIMNMLLKETGEVFSQILSR